MPAPASLPLPDPPLSNGVVTLRAWASSDAEGLMGAGSDPMVRRFRPSQPATEDQVRAWHAAVEPARLERDQLELAVTNAGDGRLLGGVTLWGVRLKHRSAMMNYSVAAEARGAGVATGAVRLLARWCFAGLHLARIQLFIVPDNDASRRVAERCGFVHEGTLGSHMEYAGQRHDSLVYGLLTGELR